MSWLGFVNYYILQWLCVRLFKTVEQDGSISEWGLLYWVRPGTGWVDEDTGEGSDYTWMQGKKGTLILKWVW